MAGYASGRHGIKYKKACREKNDADLEFAGTWTSTVLSQVVENFESQNIYSTDETGIYYCALPSDTLVFATEKLIGTKKAKDRITALVAVNMDDCASPDHWEEQESMLLQGSSATANTPHQHKCMDDW